MAWKKISPWRRKYRRRKAAGLQGIADPGQLGNGGSMSEVETLMSEVTRKLLQTREYNQYSILLDRVKAQPELYRRIGEFRRRSIGMRLSDESQKIHANSELQNEFGDLQASGLANDFMVAEQQYCKIVRKLQEQLLEEARIEIGFLEE